MYQALTWRLTRCILLSDCGEPSRASVTHSIHLQGFAGSSIFLSWDPLEAVTPSFKPLNKRDTRCLGGFVSQDFNGLFNAQVVFRIWYKSPEEVPLLNKVLMFKFASHLGISSLPIYFPSLPMYYL